jgi:hypothetical protein
MVFSLILTYVVLNVIENRKVVKSGIRVEKDRRNFTYSRHIPERRSGHEMRISDRRFEKDRRYFTYATHIPERRTGTDRRSNQS